MPLPLYYPKLLIYDLCSWNPSNFSKKQQRIHNVFVVMAAIGFELETLKRTFCENFKRAPSQLATLKRNAHANCQGTQGKPCVHRGSSKYQCRRCSKLNKSLCRNYHNNDFDAVDELVSRLVYETVFDMISISDVRDGKWLDPRLRDSGHHYWMVRLVKRAEASINSPLEFMKKLNK